MLDEPQTAPTADPDGSVGTASPGPASLPGALPVPPTSTPALPTAKRYQASIYSRPELLPEGFVSGIQALEAIMGMPVWFLVQNEDPTPKPHEPWGLLAHEVFEGFFKERSLLKKGGHVALLIDSPGGSAMYAFKLAKLLRNHAGGFTAVVPLFAKSAATLLTLGADQIILAQDAELGPLDAQHYDAEREEISSALNEVQSLARLNADALAAVDSAMWLLGMRSGKKVSTLLPIATNFVIGMLGAMFDKLDTVHFSQMARILKEAEDYAVRLLQPRYSEEQAKGIASHLVTNYPEHGFPIDPEEAASFGLLTIQPSPDELAIIEGLMPYLDKITAIGHLKEVPTP